VVSDNLADTKPFRLLADSVPVAPAEMGDWTLVAVPTSFDGTPGFVLLADRVNLAIMDRAEGEELQDHACAIKSSG
jgi:CDP-diacylglycerol pyrophosphatase